MTVSEDVSATGVVVGADGSAPGNAALRWAADAAVAHGLPLTVVHARPDVEGVVQEVTGESDVLAAAAEAVRARHPELTVRTLRYPEPPVQSLLAAGDTADFIVIGSRGLGGFRGLLVGSTALQVAPYAPCPVVVVHPEHDDTTDGPHPGDVVLGYDGSPAANRASAFAFRHAQAVGGAVVVVSVEPGRGDPEIHDVQPGEALPGSDTGAFHAPLLVTAGSFPDVPVKFLAGAGRPAEVLIRESKGCHLLVVGMRGRGGFAGLIMGSVSQKVLAHAPSPVAFLHAGMPAKAAAGRPD
jgi:nucleotide-binding universal stress UspA family protein